MTSAGSITAYEFVVNLNDQVIALITKFKATGESDLLAQAFAHLAPITHQEITHVLDSLKLQHDHFQDMKQDAFIKFMEAVGNYSQDRCPSFVSFWRISVYRHLLSQYYRKERMRTVSTPASWEPESHDPNVEDTLFTEDLLRLYQIELDKRIGKDNPAFVMANAILEHRILTSPETRVSQKTLANSFQKTQGYVAIWERWIQHEIYKGHKGNYVEE